MDDWDAALEAASNRRRDASPSVDVPPAAVNAAPPKSIDATDWDSAISNASRRVGSGNRKVESQARAGATGSFRGGATGGYHQRFDPSVPIGSYTWNEVKKLPGGIIGLVPDLVMAGVNTLYGQPANFGQTTRAIHGMLGVNQDMLPPSKGAEMGGIIAQNVVGSLPYAGADN